MRYLLLYIDDKNKKKMQFTIKIFVVSVKGMSKIWSKTLPEMDRQHNGVVLKCIDGVKFGRILEYFSLKSRIF